MKIAILVSGFPPRQLAGTEIATYNIAKHLAKLGHEVHIITSLDEGLPKESAAEGFYIHRVRVIRKTILGFASFFINVFLVIRKVNPDLVHAQSIALAAYALMIKVMLKKPYVVYGRGSDIYLSSRFYSLLSRLTLMNAGAVIAQTNNMKGAMQEICERDIFVIPNGVNMDRFSRLSREESRSKLNIKGSDIILLFVGGLRSIKGVRYLVESMSIIKQESGNVRLLIIGDGKERQDLEKLATKLNLNECIHFVRQVPNEVIPEYMISSDLFILPSLSEGFPVTVLEAMAAGLPIVITRVGGMPEIVREGENGFLVEPKNPGHIAEKVRLLLEDNELRWRISENNRKKAEQYSWERIARNIQEVYTEVV